MPDSNAREFTRITSSPLAQIAIEGSDAISGHVRDISMNGFYMLTDADVAPGQACGASVILGEGDGALHIRANARVTRNDPGGIAVQFEELIGEESYAYLQNLVRYNAAGQVDQVEEEFSTHRGLKRHPKQDD